MNQSIPAQVLKYMNHLPTCNKVIDWFEADDAFANTPNQFRDEGYHIALQELQAKKETCTCGLDELLAGASFRESLGKEGGVLHGGGEPIEFAEWIAENDWGCLFVPEENRHPEDEEGLLWVKENKDGVENALRTPELYNLFKQDSHVKRIID